MCQPVSDSSHSVVLSCQSVLHFRLVYHVYIVVPLVSCYVCTTVCYRFCNQQCLKRYKRLSNKSRVSVQCPISRRTHFVSGATGSNVSNMSIASPPPALPGMEAVDMFLLWDKFMRSRVFDYQILYRSKLDRWPNF